MWICYADKLLLEGGENQFNIYIILKESICKARIIHECLQMLIDRCYLVDPREQNIPKEYL